MSSKARWIVEEYKGFKWKQLGRRKHRSVDEIMERLGPTWLQVIDDSDTRIRNTRTGQVIYIAEVNRAA